MAGPPPQWPFGGVAPPGVAASGAQWFAGFAGEAGTPQNPVGALAGEGARAGAAGAGPGGAAGPGTSGPSGSAGTSDTGGSAPGQRVAKVRKPYTITKQRERWTDEEHERFLAALKLHGRAWRKIEEHIGTKSAVQIRSHAQKFFSKLQRETQRAKREGAETGAEGTETESETVRIPPARPKRKPNHPYPRKAQETNVRNGGGGGKTSASAAARENVLSANVLNAFGIAAGASHNPMYPNGVPIGAMFNGVGLGAQVSQTQQNAALAAYVAAARGGSFFPDAQGGVSGANPFAPGTSHNHTHTQQQQQELLRAAAANAGGFGALFASNPMALAQMATQGAGASPNVTPQMAQAAQAQQFFAALAAMGGAMPGVGPHSASVIAEPQSLVSAVPAEVQRPAARPTGDAAAAADVYAAMLAAAAAGPAAAPAAAAAAAAQGASTPLAGGGSGSAFKAFADPAAAGSGAAGAAGPSAEQMAALANVMLFFPDGGAAAGAEAAAAKPEMPPAGSAPAMAPAPPHALAGAQPSAERIAGRQPSRPVVMAGKDAAGLRESSSEKGLGSGDDDGGSGSDRGGAGSGDRGGSGSGSGEGGSGQSAQTKASNGRGASGGRGVSRGFESSSQREPSPPQPRR